MNSLGERKVEMKEKKISLDPICLATVEILTFFLTRCFAEFSYISFSLCGAT
jgi:hypothetical protein